jgi:hypothetical protein
VEHVIERDPRRQIGLQGAFPRSQGFESYADIVVACGLVTGKGASVAPDVGQVRRETS